jgi:hypothetical protein
VLSSTNMKGTESLTADGSRSVVHMYVETEKWQMCPYRCLVQGVDFTKSLPNYTLHKFTIHMIIYMYLRRPNVCPKLSTFAKMIRRRNIKFHFRSVFLRKYKCNWTKCINQIGPRWTWSLCKQWSSQWIVTYVCAYVILYENFDFFRLFIQLLRRRKKTISFSQSKPNSIFKVSRKQFEKNAKKNIQKHGCYFTGTTNLLMVSSKDT